MAGQPRRKALIAEIERRTREQFEDDDAKTHVDFVCDWLESGRTMLDLTKELNKKLKFETPVTYGSVSKYFRELTDTAEARMHAARTKGSYAIADSTADIADEKVETKEDAARARNRINSRQWLAEKFNREQFGQPRPGTTVNISMAGAHLDALRLRVVATVSSPARESDTAGSAIDGAITQDAEVLSIEASTS